MHNLNQLLNKKLLMFYFMPSRVQYLLPVILNPTPSILPLARICISSINEVRIYQEAGSSTQAAALMTQMAATTPTAARLMLMLALAVLGDAS